MVEKQNKLVSLFNNTVSPHVAVGFSDKSDNHEISEAHKNGLDVAELRVDLYSDRTPEYVLEHVSKFSNIPTIATIRAKNEGGNWEGSESERLKLFEALIPHVDSIDIELASDSILEKVVAAANSNNKQVIISYHNYEKTPSENELNNIIKDALSAGADIIKIATQIGDDSDIHILTKTLLNHSDKKLIVIGMGSKGFITRLIFPLYGSLLTFSFIGMRTAPGQMPFSDFVWQLRHMYPKYNERQIIDNELLECA